MELGSCTCQQIPESGLLLVACAMSEESERNFFSSQKIKLADCLLEYYNFQVDELDWSKGNQTQLQSKTGVNYTLPAEFNEFSWEYLCNQKLGRMDQTSAISSRM